MNTGEGGRVNQQVLYRVWRPQDFDELVGQEHIRRTLENEVLHDRISHAYLFAGPKGTGKTSAARILAKSLNCADRHGARPCGVCESCRTITSGNSMDVLEIDGASNRGIDEMRDIKEKINFVPALGKYRVYIVDEAHMLTPEAFNALLKTLEEQPEHVIFILATTDAQKMPQTVLSRCQRFDFRKLSYNVIKTRLEEILAGLGRQAAPEALALIIRQADGSLRDAISLLDQCLSFSLETLTVDDAGEILGMVRQEALDSLLSAIITGDAVSLFTGLESLFNQGVDPVQLLKEFAGYCRDLLLMALCGPETALVTAADAQRRQMREQSEKLGPAGLQRIVTQAEQSAAGGRYKGNAYYMAEALFAGLLLDAAGPAAPGTGAGTGTPARRTRAAAASAPDTTAQAQAQEHSASAASMPDAADSAGISTAHTTGEAAPATDTIAPTATDTATAATAPTAALASGELPSRQWEQILQIIKGWKIILQALLLSSVRQEIREGVLVISFDPEKGSFHMERCRESDNLQMIKEAAAQVFGSPVGVVCELLNGKQEKDPVDKAIELFGRDKVKIL